MDKAVQPIPRRSMLFVPGLRPDRAKKAFASQADVVCVDLEDAVAIDHKDDARSLALPLFAESNPNGCERVLRINSLDTVHGLRDVDAIARLKHVPDAVMMTKVRSASEVKLLEELLQGAAASIKFYVTLETNRGLEDVFEIAGASPRMACLLFGEVDLSADLRCKRTSKALLYARSRMAHAAATFELDAMDVPHIHLEDVDSLRTAAAHAAELGFTGKACIHPTQIPIVHEYFTPSAEEVANAELAVEAFRQSGETGLAVLNGLMLQKPVLRSSQRILALARQNNAGRREEVQA
ncbi:HpcH/HpaI aldolase/citrate lyase family protein [Cupriavidus consociatus]|uniref:HpcH/HpaI aldolase/citrate lyase family protein n=1 Tax=Cupriavidus consociatus TaxID=2821357 RepID=UPI001AE60A53|nr:MULTISPECIES: CoA ester lyase [unclassified Cupriavidus]MBP0625084.1 CoA ester lyase [Cupriavidus sp. LEh25]MDK2661820.1 CoA ester lyase [Cupriavidus sp. LEh21]